MSAYGRARVGTLSPWAEAMLTREEISLVRRSKVVLVSGDTARGPWTASGPGGRHVGALIRPTINLAAG